MFQEFGKPIMLLSLDNLALLRLFSAMGMIKSKTLFDILFEKFNLIVDHHRETLDPDSPRDFLDCFLLQFYDDQSPELEAESRLSIRNVLLDLFIGGIETTGTSLTWSVYFLAKHPEMQRKLQEELDAVVGNKSVRLADGDKLPYTKSTISEIFRLSSVFPMAVFHATTTDSTADFEGFKLPPQTLVSSHLMMILRNEREFPNPEAFMPERHLNSSGQFQPSSHLIPFGLGKRRCLGETFARNIFFLFFANLSQKFNFEAVHLGTEPEWGFTHGTPKFSLKVTKRF
uniref:Cytochrome P450 3083A1 n=1 Tax=Paracyclopina nana TaxID=565004 RepID=A0A0F7J2T1_PARNA|nr:cytochrome P450 3083A1 [Paracyclopina nana]